MAVKNNEHVIIIGNGISGITCARHLRKKNGCRITVISAETEYFYSRTALMYVYMGHMKFEHIKPYEDWFWKKNKISLIYDYVENIETGSRTLKLKSGSSLKYDVLVIATGSKSNKFGWPGEDLKGVQGLYDLQDLQLMEENTKNISHAVVTGGGLIGIEMAEMLHSRKIHVTFLVREKNFWNNILPDEESMMISKHIFEHKVDLRLQSELKEICGDENGNVNGVITNEGEKINCEFVGLTVGVSPNISFLKNSAIQTERGVLVNEYFETSCENVYAIGDCAQFRSPVNGRKLVEQVWYTGRMHGETLAKTLSDTRTSYSPGKWFNSAKFFDIEYQTYGDVAARIDLEKHETFYWEYSNGKIALRLVFNKNDHVLTGINVLGMRIRHDLADRWLNSNTTVEYVIEHLADANFDPEFYEGFEKKIIKEFNLKFRKELQFHKKNSLNIFNFSRR